MDLILALSDSSPPLDTPPERIDAAGALLMDPIIVCARAREPLVTLFRLARDPMCVLVSVDHPPSRVLASVLQPSASEECGNVALVGGDGNGVSGGGLAGDGDRDARYERSLDVESDDFPEREVGLDGDDGTFVTVWEEFDRGLLSPAFGMMSDAGRAGRAGAERVLACDSSPSDASLAVT